MDMNIVSSFYNKPVKKKLSFLHDHYDHSYLIYEIIICIACMNAYIKCISACVNVHICVHMLWKYGVASRQRLPDPEITRFTHN